MKILTVIGARPQFVKAAPVSKLLRKNNEEILLHTGQHYDENMSDSFFKDLNIPEPEYNLGVGSSSHGKQTGMMLEGIETAIMKENPDLVLLYGDTNSTIGGSLAAVKLHIPVAHIESGLRSFNRYMPEEINRVTTDHLSSILFAPTDEAVKNLENEGIPKERIFRTGDVMYDAFLYAKSNLDMKSILEKFNLKENEYVLSTVHRPENTDSRSSLKNLLDGLNGSPKKVVLPLHPRTRSFMEKYSFKKEVWNNIQFIDPVGYLDFIGLEMGAWKIATDSGGIQKEAYMAKKPCITMRKQTEWVETVNAGWNVITSYNTHKIVENLNNFNPDYEQPPLYGDGRASYQISKAIDEFNSKKIPL